MAQLVPSEFLEAISASSLELLRDIRAVHVTASYGDATAIIDSGAVLLGVASVSNDENEDYFRFLLGLPKDVTLDPYLRHIFPGAK